MKSFSATKNNLIVHWLLSSLVVFSMTATIIFSPALAKRVNAQQDSPQTISTVFSNPAAIAPVDRASNNAGTNPGLPSLYPSPIVVSGLTGTITKVTVTFSATSTFPDDFDILLVGPTGAKSLVLSDGGLGGDISNVSYTFDQLSATIFPDAPATPVPAGTYQPSNYLGFVTPEPGGQDNFPTAGGLMSYPTTFAIFNGTNPNGTWNLYVVDDQVIDNNSLPGGWSIDITTAPVVTADAPVDLNGDGRTDYAIVRNTGGGPGGQVTWFYNLNNSANPTVGFAWGLATDFFVPEDYDGDDKDDIAVWRPGAAGVASFYIYNSATATVRVEAFGQSGDDPTMVDDYNNDNKADLAVYRGGANPGDQSTWFYRTAPNGAVTYITWGQNGDFPCPGDYDGNGSADFVVQRNGGGGQAAFWTRLSTGATSVTIFGTPTDAVVPGDWDGDGKTDIATVKGVGGSYEWHYLSSLNGSTNYITFGSSASDVLVQGDYDGDGKTDAAVWRPSVSANQTAFYSRSTSSGAVTIFAFGANGDYPPANYNQH